MKYRLVVTPRAMQDRNDAYRWYCDHYSPEFADRWYLELSDAVESLQQQPGRCPRSMENCALPFEVRELLFGRRHNKFRILFRIDGDSVVVLFIRHSARRELTEEEF